LHQSNCLPGSTFTFRTGKTTENKAQKKEVDENFVGHSSDFDAKVRINWLFVPDNFHFQDFPLRQCFDGYKIN
jgi:hypothetical protein